MDVFSPLCIDWYYGIIYLQETFGNDLLARRNKSDKFIWNCGIFNSGNNRPCVAILVGKKLKKKFSEVYDNWILFSYKMGKLLI